MPHIDYSTEFADEQTLFGKMIKKHEALGTKSPLTAFFKLHNVDVAAMKTAASDAKTQDDDHISQLRNSENSTQKRNINMKQPWENLLGAVQFLKSLNKGNTRALGEWAVTVDGKNKIVYPPSFPERAKLVQDFYAKHKEYPAGESPLQIYLDQHSIDVDADLSDVSKALENEADKTDQTNASQLATQKRNLIWAPVQTLLHDVGTFLMNFYKENSREMGAWGYKVVEDTAGQREQTSILKQLESRTTKGIVLGTFLFNAGEGELHLQKGGKQPGDIIVIKPGEKVAMIKGYSSILITNPSSILMGKYIVTVTK